MDRIGEAVDAVRRALGDASADEEKSVADVIRADGLRAVEAVRRARAVAEVEAAITPEVVAAARREGLFLTRLGHWWADWGDAHAYPLSEHGPARNWLLNYFEGKKP